MKKVLIISSSPRPGGNSDILCDRFAKGAGQAGHEVEKISLREHVIGYCRGCGVCYNDHRPCPQQDDMPVLLQKLIDCDVLVLATPVYFYTLCGQLKTFIDRTCSRYSEIRHKEVYFILTAAEETRESLARTIEDLRGFRVCLEGSTEKGILYGTGLWQKGDIEGKPILDDAFQMGLHV